MFNFQKQNAQSPKKRKSKYLEPQDSVSTTITSESDEEESEDENEEESMDEQARCSAEQFYDNGGELKVCSLDQFAISVDCFQSFLYPFSWKEKCTDRRNS